MKTNFILLASLIITLNIFSQDSKGISGNENWFQNWTSFKPNTLEYRDANIILSGNINTNTTLFKKNVYTLMGNVYVTNNATLSIEPGTVIRGDFDSVGALIITKGAKIIADGNETDPIILTSNKNVAERRAGDWGGLIILGEATINKFGGYAVLDLGLDQSIAAYGGANDASNSGILKYVRIEFAGKKLPNGKEFNGLSLAGIGNKTTLQFIQVSFSNDDSVEFYGGNLNISNVVSFKSTDDDFDFTQGSQTILSNSIAVRSVHVSDKSKSRCIEIESFDKVENMDFSKKLTKVDASNITLVSYEDRSEGLAKEAIYIKDKSILNIDKSIISGFESGILIAESSLNKQKDIDTITFKDSNLNDCGNFFSCEYLSNNINTDTQNSAYFMNNTLSKITNTELFKDINLKKNPDFRFKGISDLVFAK